MPRPTARLTPFSEVEIGGGLCRCAQENTSFFQLQSGSWKPLSEVKDYVGAYLYADLLKSIESSAKETGALWPKQEADSRFPQPLDLYAQYRLRSYALEALSSLQDGASKRGVDRASVYRRREPYQRAMATSENNKELTRGPVQALNLAVLFEQPLPVWSSLISLQPAQWAFFRVLESKKEEKLDLADMVEIRTGTVG